MIAVQRGWMTSKLASRLLLQYTTNSSSKYPSGNSTMCVPNCPRTCATSPRQGAAACRVGTGRNWERLTEPTAARIALLFQAVADFAQQMTSSGGAAGAAGGASFFIRLSCLTRMKTMTPG